MGLSLEFYAGDPELIGSAFTKIEFDGLRDGTIAHAYADLSLHLSPTDLDILSEQFSATLGSPVLPLLESLERRVGGTSDESEASVVADSWVTSVATVPLDHVALITRLWLRAVAQETGDNNVVTESPDAVTAVASLIKLCREAVTRGTKVVFAWYL